MAREKQRAEKLLESAAIKISSVVTDLHGVTGRDIMNHLIAAERNPKVLAQLARAAAHRKISQLEEAAEGAEFFTARRARAVPAWSESQIGRVNPAGVPSAAWGRLPCLTRLRDCPAPGRRLKAAFGRSSPSS